MSAASADNGLLVADDTEETTDIAFDPRFRFWSKVDWSGGPSACWPWLGARDAKGYGMFKARPGVTIRAHRALIKIFCQRLRTKDWVLHGCDNPPCVNPAHLAVGTASENSQQMIQRGRRGIQRPDDHAIPPPTDRPSRRYVRTAPIWSAKDLPWDPAIHGAEVVERVSGDEPSPAPASVVTT